MLAAIKAMNDKYHKCLDVCKDYNANPTFKTLVDVHVDKIIYQYAFKMCQRASIDELIGERQEVGFVACFHISLIDPCLYCCRA